MDAKHKYITPANLITFARMLLAPVYICACIHWALYGILVLSIGACTDWLDGFIARKMRCQSDLGILLDPLADKLLCWCALWVITQHLNHIGLNIAASIIVTRDIWICKVRIHAFLRNQKRISLPVSLLAKYKTACLFLSLICLTFYLSEKNILVYRTGTMLLYISSLLTVLSFWQYSQKR